MAQLVVFVFRREKVALALPRVPLWLVALTLLLPLLLPLQIYPLPDWGQDHVASALVVLAWLLRLLQSETTTGQPAVVPRALLFGWGLAAYIVLSYALLVSDSYVSRSLGPLVFLVIAGAAGRLCFDEARRLGRQEVVSLLAWLLWLGGLLQAVLGLIQVSGLAPLLHGVLFDRSNPSGNIMGNIGQRNQYAHYLGWGMAASCYLYSGGKLRAWAFHLSALFLALLMGWSGSRLVLAYGAGFAVLALLWYWRAEGAIEEGARARRLAKALLIACAYMFVAQLLLEPLSYGLHLLLGQDVVGTSGAGRLLEKGFGARRRVEWAKAWQMFLAHPLFGSGWGSFAYQSVALEAFGGYAKVSENALFAHSHNLFTQLLAETGLVGTAIVAFGLVFCLQPYFRKSQVTAENLLLVSLALVTLGHSMFEYPLWYMPFLCGFMIILSLSPVDGVMLPVRPRLRQLATGAVVLLVGGYLVSGIRQFSQLVEASVPSRNAKINEQRITDLLALARNPLWAYEAEQQLILYLSPDKHQLALKRELLERLAAYRPFSYTLLLLAVLRALDHDEEGARKAMAMCIAAYPQSVKTIQMSLQGHSEPELQPLRIMAARAVSAYRQGGAEAAARSASQPEVRPATLF